MTTEARLSPRDAVLRQADEQARLYLWGEEHGQRVTREQKEVIESIIATDYDGRTVIELLQNAHDAHPRERHDGALEVLLDEDEEEHGVLYVANCGVPFDSDDFESICSLGLSSKRPDEGIGNKGVGFKSVLQLAESPEIYSASVEGGRAFDGFRFRFAAPADFDDVAQRVAPDRAGFADELRENVAGLKATVPIDSVPPHVSAWAERGFVTLVRLALRSDRARTRAREQIQELESADVPFHLFLERVRTVTLERRVSAGGGGQVVLTRQPPEDTEEIRAGSLRGAHLELQDGTRFLLLHRSVPEAAMRRAIAASRIDVQLGTSWEDWKGDADVAIALLVDGPLESGRLYTFLPMSTMAPAPFPGFANAPFFARLDRRSLEESVPLNELLLDEIANLCTDAVVCSLAGELELQPEQLIDLIAWSPAALPRLLSSFERRDAALPELPVLQALGTDNARVALNVAKLWRSDGHSFTAEAVAQAGVEGLVDPSFDETRHRRLLALANSLDLSLVASDQQLAEFAEVYVAALAAEPFSAEAWVAFFDDLAISFKRGDVLRGRLILCDDQGRLVAANGGVETRTVFVARSDDDGDDPAPVPPPVVASLLAFTHPAIPRRTHPGGPLRPGWKWLDDQGLVQEYRTEAVLGLVGKAMQAAEVDDEDSRVSCLRFAFDLWRGAREISATTLKAAGLLVPATSGWIAPKDAVFGSGWEGPDAETDDLLERLLARAGDSAHSLAPVAEGVLRVPETIIADAANLDQLRSFIELLGVRHGLVARYIASAHFRMRGEQVANPKSVGRIWGIDVDAGDQTTWREVAAHWPRQHPSFATTEYSPRGGVAILPGQREWNALDGQAREIYSKLVLRGLAVWPDSALEAPFTRFSDPVSVAWPSFIASFLATAEWIPQTAPGDRATVTLMSPGKAWWLKEADTPDYLHTQPAALRKLATPVVLERLRKIGVRFWDEPASAADRLLELADLAEGSSRVPIRKAYEEAWRDLDAIDGIAPQRIVASRHARLAVVDLSEDGEPIYVPVDDGLPKERLLGQAPVLMLAIRDRSLAGRAQRRLEASGAVRLRPTSDAEVIVTADGLPAERLHYGALSELGQTWLPMLVLGVLEHRDTGIPRVSEAHLRRSGRSLIEAKIALAREVVTSVDGHVVEDTVTAQSFLLDGSRILVEASEDTDHWEVLQGAASALAELVDRPGLEGDIRLALIDLERRGCDVPNAHDVAAVLSVHPSDVVGLLDTHVDVTDVLAVLACLDVQIAEELRDGAPHLDGRDALQQWLTDHLPPPLPSASTVLELAGRADPLAVIRELGVPLADANASWRALGLSSLQNPQGHQRAFEAYVQNHRSALHDRLRDRFASAALDGAPLDDYVRLRDLPDLRPDPAWLDVYWELPDDVIQTAVDIWLNAVAPGEPDTSLNLPSVDQLRESGRRTLASVIANARVLVDAWLHRHAAGTGNRPSDLGSLTEAMTLSGKMDFKRLTATDVVAWLQEHGQWPQEMPPTTSRTELGLSAEDVEAARARLDQDRERRRRQETYVEYGGRTYSEDLADLRELADAMRAELRSNPVHASAEPHALVEIDVDLPGDSKPRGKRGTRGSSPPKERSTTIGLAGEIVVGEWLYEQFAVPPEDSWQSGYRLELLGDGVGSDELGYDFRVVTDERTLLFEAKSSTGDNCEFRLSESEVRRAQELAPDEEYIIVFVPHVLDPGRRRVIPLPNPFAHGGLRRYRMAGSSLRLQFELATRDEPAESE